MLKLFFVAGLLATLALSTGCGSMIKSASQSMAKRLSASVQRQNDLETVRLGAPAYILLMDALVLGDPEDDEPPPDDPKVLVTASKLLTAYAAAFSLDNNAEQARNMTAKARDYAIRALSAENETFAESWMVPAREFDPVPAAIEPGQESYLLAVVQAWAMYIKARPGSWTDVADLPKIQALTERLIELNEGYGDGAPHLVLGVLKTLLPPSVGGKPEEAKTHFERAMELSGGNNLMVHVTYARSYARPLLERELHDRLVSHVLETPVDAMPNLTLSNTLARKRAEALAAEADDFF